MSMIMIRRHAHVLLISQYWLLRVNIHSKSLEYLESIDHWAHWLCDLVSMYLVSMLVIIEWYWHSITKKYIILWVPKGWPNNAWNNWAVYKTSIKTDVRKSVQDILFCLKLLCYYIFYRQMYNRCIPLIITITWTKL